MNTTQKAVALFNNGLNCAQAILTAFGEKYGIDPETAKKIGRPWGGGIGRMGEICGAMTGAITLLGYAVETQGDEAEARDQVSAAVQSFSKQFSERNGSLVCRDILGADFATGEGRKRIKEEALVKTRCPKFVEDAGDILAKMGV